MSSCALSYCLQTHPRIYASLNHANIDSDNGLSFVRRQPTYCLNQYRVIVNWTIGNNFQANFKQNTNIFSQENTSENVCNISAIMYRHQRDNCVFLWFQPREV